jgi:mycobactin lysine-N-oxygenase
MVRCWWGAIDLAKRLAIVGAGAKAAAIVARAAALRALGVPDVPEVVVFEANDIGAAWSGQGGFSDGVATLCTPGEKDVGFPYPEIARRGSAREAVGPYLFAHYSWSAYLVARGRFMDWVDRGREHPTHADWAGYLQWVFTQAGQAVQRARVREVQPRGGRWLVSFSEDSGPALVESFDGVVLTGTGRAKGIDVDASVPAGRIFDAETFWSSRNSVLSGADTTVTVVGDGGAAGTIIAWLVEHFAEGERSVLCLSSMGTLFPRGDGHSERRWFSDPADWHMLSPKHRRKLMERTEAGVISLRNKRTIDRSSKVQMHIGRADRATWSGPVGSASGDISLENSYDGQAGVSIKTDFLICAIGFDPWSLLELVDAAPAQKLARGSNHVREQVEAGITADLALPPLSGLPAGLHVPALAGFAHGPGMGNLGCLGLMAQAVLKPYL